MILIIGGLSFNLSVSSFLVKSEIFHFKILAIETSWSLSLITLISKASANIKQVSKSIFEFKFTIIQFFKNS
ncbi:TPA: hypothetical protein DCZ31_03250 [Patescibacteria group bacterium]|nr:hypothetical protein [Candidatus Gracilibacteria bacterium]